MINLLGINFYWSKEKLLTKSDMTVFCIAKALERKYYISENKS